MHTLIVTACAFGALLVSGAAQANEALAKSKNCMSCHTVDKKLVGPAYKDIATKYKGKNMEAQMVQSIIKGSSGKWGPIPMPANNVSEGDARTLAKWILSL